MVAQLSDVANKSFDYVIVGGGTAGLTLAARLVEDSSERTVLVLEAGEPNLNDPKILLGGGFGATFGDPKYDWCHMTVPQPHANHRVMPWNRGKGLGGSSHMNFYAWMKPPAADVDAFEELGNPGWNWKSYQKYTLRAEEFTAATEDQLAELAHTHNVDFRGRNGPIKTTIPGRSIHINKNFLETVQKKGAKLVHDAYGGDITGCWQGSSNLDRQAQWTRSYAATAHYLPYKDKPNFIVITEAIGARVLFKEGREGGKLVASGVEFVHGGQTHRAYANKEVVLSAGTVKSPQLLELSGIGQRAVLEAIGVPVRHELAGVGENMQDHLFSGISYELEPKEAQLTFDVFRDPELAAEQGRLQSLDQLNAHRYGITAFAYLPVQMMNPPRATEIVEGVTKLIEEQKKSGKLPPGLAEQYDIQLRNLKNAKLPDLELIAFPGYMTFPSVPEKGKAHVTILIVLQHPFSRGSVHAKSNNPLEDPAIDPHYYENPYDLELFTENAKYAKNLAQTEPFKSSVVREIDPGANTTSDEGIKEYLKKNSGTCYHAVGTLSMLPLEKNGVVDTELRVYGTKNLRVADLSVIPLEVSAHTQATAYFVGEKAADILKGVA